MTKFMSITGAAVALSLLALLPVAVSAAEPISQLEADKILASMRQARPGIPLGDVYTTPLKNIYRVSVGKQNLYISADGKHFIAGDLIEITPTGFFDPLDAERAENRKKLVKNIDIDKQIVFSPKGETRAYINVFTDVDCGYCLKLHKQMSEMNAEGIEVRYLAYPRSGIGGSSYKKIATAWCADDPQKALTDTKNGKKLPLNVCVDNPVAEHYTLGGQFGVTGTPALVLADGRLIPGYMPTAKLLQTLGLKSITNIAGISSQ